MTDKEEFPPLFPPGFHPKTVAELRSICVDNFLLSTRRPLIMNGLEKFIDYLKSSGIVGTLWVDGSFITEKIDPDDADVTLCIHADLIENGTTAQTELIEEVTREDLKDKFKDEFYCDPYPLVIYTESDPLYWYGAWMTAYWVRQFGFSRGMQMKGIVTIDIGASE